MKSCWVYYTHRHVNMILNNGPEASSKQMSFGLDRDLRPILGADMNPKRV